MQKGVKWKLKAVSLLFFGAVLLGVGLFIRRSATAYEDGILATGEITEVFLQRNDNGGDTYQPEITFITDAGRTVVFRDKCTSNSRPEVGDEVRVSYRASDPSEARNLEGFGIIIIGGCILVVSLVSAVAVFWCFCVIARPPPVDSPPTAAHLYSYPQVGHESLGGLATNGTWNTPALAIVRTLRLQFRINGNSVSAWNNLYVCSVTRCVFVVQKLQQQM